MLVLYFIKKGEILKNNIYWQYNLKTNYSTYSLWHCSGLSTDIPSMEEWQGMRTFPTPNLL